MTFEFAKYTEITDFALKTNPEYVTGNYVRVFICPDVWDFWLVRIMKGYEDVEDEGYVPNEDNYILERNKIEMDVKGQSLTISKVRQIIEDDDFSNWDILQGEDIEELIDSLDQGYGILDRKELEETKN